jgi:signal transduction histidine kinase
MTDLYLIKGDKRTALSYALQSLQLAKQHHLKDQVAGASLKLSEIYEQEGDMASSLRYYKQHIAYRDSVNNLTTVQRMADLRTDFEVSKKQVELDLANQQKQNERNRTILLAIILALSVIILGVLIRSNKHKQKAYKVLNLQRKKTEEQKERAEGALLDLQEAQKHLIQSAKMASLGELTAGIAHEIQNPLNFVNNFSEISVELLDELKTEALDKLPASDKAGADGILQDLSENLKKISDHGKRAGSIVKGMLQHTRVSTGKKELTDINALASEYLRLSYLGVRAKDKDFSTQLSSNLDETIGQIEVVPQDIGRVLLNLYNNAYYAVDHKKKLQNDSYEPLISVSSKRNGDSMELSVRDNGIGIPKNILDKIYQPFFTTKPTGQGTGLGLWLSYDIIEAHGGEIKVKTQEGEFTEFIIHLPINHHHQVPA